MRIFLIGLLFPLFSLAEPYKVAIIDSGFSPMPGDSSVLKLCKSGHYDYVTKESEVGADYIGHGSFVTYLINRHSKTKNMCYLIYKVFGNGSDEFAIEKAFLKAYKEGARAINFSMVMFQYSHRARGIVKYITNKGVKIFASAGNSHRNMNTHCTTYPVCFKGINSNLVVVGSTDVYGGVASYSNYGARIDVYEFGDMKQHRGTSFAAPRALGKYINSLKLDKRK